MVEIAAAAETIKTVTETTDKILDIMDRMQSNLKSMLPFDVLKSAREDFAKNLDKIVEVVGEETIETMEMQNDAMMKTLNIR